MSEKEAAVEDGLLDVEAAAKVLGVKPRWIRRAVADRRITYIKVGRLLRFERSALNELKATNTVQREVR